MIGVAVVLSQGEWGGDGTVRLAFGLIWPVACVVVVCQFVMTLMLLRRRIGEPVAQLADRVQALAHMARGDRDAAPVARLGAYGDLAKLHENFDAMERALRADRRQFASSFDLLTRNLRNMAVFLTDANGRIRNWNIGAERITGYSAQEAIGAHVTLLYLETQARRRDPESLLALARELGVAVESERRKRRDGSVFWALTRVEPVYGDNGVLIGFAHVLEDVSAAREQASKVDENVRVLRMAEETAGIGHWRLTLEGQHVTFSDMTYRIYGVPPGDPVSFDWAVTAFAESDRAIVTEKINRAIADLGSYAFRATLVRRDGMHRHVDVRGQIELDVAGAPCALFGVMQDVTEDVAVLKAMTAARDDAHAAAEAKNRLLATMSHEIRTPLTGILGMLDTVDPHTDPVGLRRDLAAVRSAAGTLKTVLDDVLDHAWLTTGKVQIEAVPYDLLAVVTTTADLFRAAASAKGVDLIVEGETALPTIGDPARVQQIVSNLIGNAVKFTSAGHIRAQVARDARGRLAVTVTDSGIGIAADAMPNLFTPFTQGEASTSRRFGGTGLGLAICQQLAEAMGGTIVVTSTPAVGSSFRLMLPAPDPAIAADDEPQPCAAQPLQIASTPHRPRRLLVVEDVETTRVVAARFLEQVGCEVLCVDTGAAALKTIATDRFDAVLLDGTLPDLAGAEVSRIARLLPRGRITIIGFTAHTDPEELARFRASGIERFLAKPFDRAAMGDMVATLPIVEEASASMPWPGIDDALDRLPTASRFAVPALAARNLYDIAAGVEALMRTGEALVSRLALAVHSAKGIAATLGGGPLLKWCDFAEAAAEALGWNQLVWFAPVLVRELRVAANALPSQEAGEWAA
ncbi:ATP-binding protein [Sphingomonas sp. HMP9]|uniref:ATP-binding protein n=1 Tax=Sphingomonas sp. HMP9 TaxID=1517554 RepID=UPI00159667E1|nr:ATP-binding protein [Sphingomonas sp. HMP9]